MRAYDLAHARAGDKGNSVNICVVAYTKREYEHLKLYLTNKVVLAKFSQIADGPVTRYLLPKLNALNFVIENTFGGGVTTNMSIDVHGKSFSSLLLTIELPGISNESL